MIVYKRGGKYYYDFVLEGKRFQASTKQSNKAAAELIEAAVRTSLAEKRAGLKRPEPVPTLSEYALRFMTYIERHAAGKPRTIKFWREKLDRLLAYSPLATANLNEIEESLIQDYIESRHKKVAPATINRELATLRRLLYRARKEKKIKSAPIITLLKGERCRTFVLSQQQESVYLAATPQPLRDAALLLLDTGLRAGEALSLEWKDVHLEPAQGCRYGYLHVRSGKSAFATRNISLTPRVKEMLINRSLESKSAFVFAGEHGKPFLVTSLCHQHNKVRTALNLPQDFVVHSLRHTMLTRLGEAGTDVFTIKQIAGHSSVKVSEKHVHPTPEGLERAFERLEVFNRQSKGLTELEDNQHVAVFTTVS
ncbi:MAG: tyrosine-type recombinase/integrase [Pyrinomonadaceae bacterium]